MTDRKNVRPVVVGITGASGAIMARATVEELLRGDNPTVALCPNPAQLGTQGERGGSVDDDRDGGTGTAAA